MPGAQRDGIQAEIKAKTRKNMPEEVERLKARLVELQQNPIYCPPLPRLQFEDTTPEGLQHDLATGWPNGGLFSDEGGAVLGSHGMSDETATRMLSLTNILWDGRDFTPTRKQAAAQLTGRRFCVFVMIQPALLSGLIQKGGRELGFVARFLISRPESTMGSRFYREPPAHWPALERFNAAITKLFTAELPIDRSGADKGALMRLVPPSMPLTADAKEAWIGFHDDIERQLGQYGELAEIRDFASKTAENAARIAAVFKLFDDGGPGGRLTLEYIEAGSALAAWHLHEARRMFLEIDTPPELADARELSGWLLNKAPQLHDKAGMPIIDADGEIATRTIQRLGPNATRDSLRRDAALKVLEESGHIRRIARGKQKRIQINPKLRQLPG